MLFFGSLNSKTRGLESDFRVETDHLITWESMQAVPLGGVLRPNKHHPKATVCTKLHQTKSTMTWRVEMEEGQFWNAHHHDCEEKCLVLEGTITEEFSGDRAGNCQILTFDSFQAHKVIAMEKTTFYVEFKKTANR